METIKDFFKELKERSSNPLISSFILAWLLCNWKITVGLIFYKFENLKVDGYKSYFALISKNISTQNSLVYPLAAALAYTFLFPWIKAKVKLFHAKIETKNETDILKATNAASIPISRYINLRKEAEETVEQLKIIYDSENQVRIEKIALEIDIIKMKHELSEMSQNYSNSELRYRVTEETTSESIMDGTWDVIITHIDGSAETKKWHIFNGIIRTNVNVNESWLIENLTVDPFGKKVAFNIRSEDGRGNYPGIFLKAKDSYDNLRQIGTPTYYKSVQFKKVSR